MKKLIILVVVFFSFTIVSCETEKSVKSEIETLKNERDKLISEVNNLNNIKKKKKTILKNIKKILKC